MVLQTIGNEGGVFLGISRKVFLWQMIFPILELLQNTLPSYFLGVWEILFWVFSLVANMVFPLFSDIKKLKKTKVYSLIIFNTPIVEYQKIPDQFWYFPPTIKMHFPASWKCCLSTITLLPPRASHFPRPRQTNKRQPKTNLVKYLLFLFIIYYHQLFPSSSTNQETTTRNKFSQIFSVKLFACTAQPIEVVFHFPRIKRAILI